MGGLFDGWTIVFLRPTFSKKRLEILHRIVKEHRGQVADLEACDKHLLEHNQKHVVIADAEPSQNLEAIFEECAKFPLADLSVYSAQWISASVKASKLCPLSDFLIQNHRPVEPHQKRIKEEDKPASLLPSDFINSPYECMRPTPLDHKNKELVAELLKIAHHRYLTGNSRSELSYNKAIATIKSYPKDIESVEEAEQLQGVGPKIVGLIGEYLSTERIREAEELANDPEAKVVDALTKIHGVGPKTAQQWYTLGIRSIEDLRSAVKNKDIVLHTDQAIGMQYYEDFAEPMTRGEVEEIFGIVCNASKRAFADAVKIEMTGGYRRGKELSGDADILIYPIGDKPSKAQIMDTLINELQPEHIKAIMQHTKAPKKVHKTEQPGLDVCYMAFQAKPGDIMKRVDFIVSTRQSYAFAMLGWTGSRQFERAIRLFAKHEHNLTLTDHDLTGSRGEQHTFDTEKEIFDYLGVPYLDPTLRNC